MVKLVILSIFSVVLISCRGEKENEVSANASLFQIQTEGWTKKTVANSKTADLIKEWEAFNSLQIAFDAIYNVGNTEDLSLVLEDLIEKQKELAKSPYPKPFDIPQIKSRQKVFHTFLLKTKGDLIYQIDTKKSVLEMIDSHNAMINQMNSITSNTLDLKSLLEEEKK
jgi:hypothetical protein